ncbi:hypothetical protein P6709_19545 [Jeotgalibacillus sp. ET6]|uniref:hypothetical protein n=1 Tax=Jeotgalibacillus sp. ET6 TaxID=3037260 RepID=UPI0024181AC4|nr:hypothetical protein [Jeotgalibacillus sp. ET6]MDG5473925.1 hypothetical protein [Jeotgalibacillus sp. ET6]
MDYENEMTQEDIQIEKLKEKIEELKKKQKLKIKKGKEKLRRERTKRLIESGAVAESILNVEGDEKIRQELERLLQLSKYLEYFEIFNARDLKNKFGEQGEKNE